MARGGRGEGVRQLAVGKGFADEAFEDIHHDDEEVREERITLPKAVSAPNPIVGHPIEKHRGVDSGKDTGHSVTLPIIELLLSSLYSSSSDS
jgi:hypothetical protein